MRKLLILITLLMMVSPVYAVELKLSGAHFVQSNTPAIQVTGAKQVPEGALSNSHIYDWLTTSQHSDIYDDIYIAAYNKGSYDQDNYVLNKCIVYLNNPDDQDSQHYHEAFCKGYIDGYANKDLILNNDNNMVFHDHGTMIYW